MTRTQGAMYGDTPHGGAFLWYGATNVNWDGTATLIYTRNAAGDYSLNTSTAATTYHITAGMADVKRQQFAVEQFGPGTQPANLPFQERFGTAAGGPGYPASAPGLPPFTGLTELTPPTLMPAKGTRIWAITVVYKITTVALTTHTINLYRTTYANNAANSIVTVPISSNALSTAVQANPYVTVVSVTTPVFETLALTDTLVEILVTTGTTSTYQFYGIGFSTDINFD
jgi:hypothetical protein